MANPTSIHPSTTTGGMFVFSHSIAAASLSNIDFAGGGKGARLLEASQYGPMPLRGATPGAQSLADGTDIFAIMAPATWWDAWTYIPVINAPITPTAWVLNTAISMTGVGH